MIPGSFLSYTNGQSFSFFGFIILGLEGEAGGFKTCNEITKSSGFEELD